MTIRAMAQRIELWPIEKLRPYDRNSRTHSDAQVAQIAGSIAEFGFCSPILVDSQAGVIAGAGRLAAARKLGLEQVPVVVLDHLSETQKRAYVIADNKLAELAGWDEELLGQELSVLEADGFDLGLTGFSEQELAEILWEEPAETAPEESIPEPPAVPVTWPGDLWCIGSHHRLLCADCRDPDAVAHLFEDRKASVVITSPPYATQRDYDASSGFRPVAPEDYVDWYHAVAENIASVLAPDGSYFLNIKEHAEDGQRSLYVKDLTLAHVRQWGWRFVDEFCWRKTENGVPGGWNNRFKNAWEPIFHFCRDPQIKFRAEAVSHRSDEVFDYSPDNRKSDTGSGLLGRRPDGVREGWARPGNVIEARSECHQGAHSAPFPRALPEFFIRAFSDPGDVIWDPFTGSGTSMLGAALLDRVGYGTELSAAYCDVVVRRVTNALTGTAVLAGTAQTFEEVAAKRGVPVDPPASRHAPDAKSIRHKNGMPYYGPRKGRGEPQPCPR